MASLTSVNKGNLIERVILMMADNETIKRNLEQVSAGEVRCDPVIRELAQAVLEEIHTARKVRKIIPWIFLGFVVIMITIVAVVIVTVNQNHGFQSH